VEEYRKADMAKIQGRIGLDDLWCGVWRKRRGFNYGEKA